jgi:hypothetical protein
MGRSWYFSIKARMRARCSTSVAGKIIAAWLWKR